MRNGVRVPPKNVSAALAVLRRICYHSRCCPSGLCKDFAVRKERNNDDGC